MDGTLTVPNLDFGEMYRRCGVPRTQDILEAVAAMPPPQRLAAAAIIEEMEAEGRRTLALMPGAVECARWLAARGVPMGLVTRNSATTVRHFHNALWAPAGLRPFAPALSRDGEVEAADRGAPAAAPPLPAKPHPAAFVEIARLWQVDLGPCLVMVGDSPANDVAFGKAAGVTTVLLDGARKYQEDLGEHTPDHVVRDLSELPGWFAERFTV